jgi:cation/acetate symporter
MAGMFETGGAGGSGSNKAFRQQLNKVYKWYTGGFFFFVITLAILEQMGLSREWIGFIFLIATIALYAGIGIMSRTTDAAEYYVAGRRVPAMYNGMATGADWMSAASFIGMAGTVYLTGYGGLAFIMGWTGGYCLVALFLAPYLRKFGQFTIPDFLGERYGGNLPRFIGIVAAILCSFTYVVAQIYGVGLITARLTGVAFELGIFLGLGGILVCSFLGGMRAVTWTQVAQYIILIIAYMMPVVWLSVKQTSVPVPQVIYGSQLQKVTQAEARLIADPKEIEVRNVFKARSEALAEKLKDPGAWPICVRAVRRVPSWLPPRRPWPTCPRIRKPPRRPGLRRRPRPMPRRGRSTACRATRSSLRATRTAMRRRRRPSTSRVETSSH